MALGVFGDVAEEEAEGDFDLLATDVAGVAVVDVFHHAELLVDAIVGFFDVGEEGVAVAGAGVFGGEVGELVFVERGAEGVGEEAVDRAGEVAELKGDLGIGLGGGPAVEVGEGVIEGTGEETAEGVEVGVLAGEPGFHRDQDKLRDKFDGDEFAGGLDVADADGAFLEAAGEFGGASGDADLFGAEDFEFADAGDAEDGGVGADEFFEDAVADGVALEAVPGVGDDDGGLAGRRGGGGGVDEAVEGGGHFAFGAGGGGEAAFDGGAGGLVGAAGAVEGQGESVPKVGLPGEDGGGALVGFDGVLPLLALGGFEAEEEPGLGVAGIAFDGLAEEGFEGLFLIATEHGGFEIGRGFGGVGGDGLVKVGEGGLVIALGEGEEAEGGGVGGAFVETGGEGGFAAGEGEFGDEFGADGVEAGFGGRGDVVAGEFGDGEGSALHALFGVAEDFEGAAAEGAGEGFSGGDAGIEEFGEGGELFAVSGLGVEEMDDGPALGVEEASAVGFIVKGGVFVGGEEGGGAHPVGLLEEADVVFDGAAEEPFALFERDGGIEFGDAFFEPEGAAGGGVFEGGVDELVGEGAEGVGAEEDGEIVAFGGGLVEAAGGGDGAELGVEAFVAKKIGAQGGLAGAEETVHAFEAGEGLAGERFAGVGDNLKRFSG